MSKLCVPIYSNNSCVHIQSSDVIRVYDNVPVPNSSVNYTDYYIKSSYISNTGVATFSQYSSIPSCYNTNDLTSSFYYRNDFPLILVTFFIILIVCIYFPYKIFSRAFGRWLKI